MRSNKLNKASLIIITIIYSLVFFLSCKEKSREGMIILTEVAGNLQNINYTTGDSWRYILESRILILNPENPSNKPELLTKEFFSACSPNISFDGRFMIFAAQKKQNDVWQVWEMNLSNFKVRQVTTTTKNCIDPVYLPDGTVLFSKTANDNDLKTGHELFTCKSDGSNMQQITFNPHNYFASSVLKDGRVLTISRQLYPDQKNSMFMVLRPDGSKSELFYQGEKFNEILSRGQETDNGQVIFIASENKERGNIITINYNRPLHSERNLTSGIKGDFKSVSPMKSKKLLTTYRSSVNETYALYEFDVAKKILEKAIYKDKNYNVLEAFLVNKRERPKKLPSEVNLSVKTGLLLCQDINFTETYAVGNTKLSSKAIKIELLGINNSLGTVGVEKDGSFYLKVLADTPFRIQTIDKNGEIVNGPSSWLYLRPSERRGCVGCHLSNEQVPENRQPLSVKKSPILIPVL